MLEPTTLPEAVDEYLFSGERWFIDELGEGVVRVLASAALDVRPFTELAHLTGHSPDEPVAVERARTLVLELESADALAAWSEEVDHLIPLPVVEKVLRARRASLGFPGDREIREGDVYWLARLAGDADSEPHLSEPTEVQERMAQMRLSTTETRDTGEYRYAVWSLVLIGYRPEWVWDVTAAARQADKWRLDRALRSSAEVRRRG